jgi:hypothetical protein
MHGSQRVSRSCHPKKLSRAGPTEERYAQLPDFAGITKARARITSADRMSHDAESILSSQNEFLLVAFSSLLYGNGARHRGGGVLSWRAPHDAAEGFTEGALGHVAERLRDGRETVRGILQAIGSQKQAPAGEVFHRRGADQRHARSV